jgi:electron transfer flavoprotein alpha subunit
MEHLAKMEGVDIVLAESGAASSESAIRLSYRLGFSAVSGLVDVSLFNGMPCAKMRAASSHLDLFRPIEKNQVLIARPSKIYSGNFDSFAPIRILPMPDVEADFIEERILPRSKASSLEDAQLLLVGGRGIKGPAAFKRLQEIAGKLGGAAGLTRAAAINGWGPMELVVGQSGIAASPKACVVFGASGAAAFMAGVEDSERLIAVNNDPDAPIFSKSDYGIIADAPSAIERLEEILSDADKGCG